MNLPSPEKVTKQPPRKTWPPKGCMVCNRDPRDPEDPCSPLRISPSGWACDDCRPAQP